MYLLSKVRLKFVILLSLLCYLYLPHVVDPLRTSLPSHPFMSSSMQRPVSSDYGCYNWCQTMKAVKPYSVHSTGFILDCLLTFFCLLCRLVVFICFAFGGFDVFLWLLMCCLCGLINFAYLVCLVRFCFRGLPCFIRLRFFVCFVLFFLNFCFFCCFLFWGLVTFTVFLWFSLPAYLAFCCLMALLVGCLFCSLDSLVIIT